MQTIHIWPQEVEAKNGQETRSALIEDCEPFTLWFAAPEEKAGLLCNRAESFVAGTVMLAMLRGYDLRVHAPLCPSFLRNVEEFQVIWSCWDKRFRQIEIVADSECEAGNTAAGSTPGMPHARAITMFSGGVDSCYTVWRHAQNRCGRRALPIQSALMIEGFDPGNFDSLFARGQRILKGMDINLIRLSTNLRFVIPLHYPNFLFGSALAACQLWFQESHSHGLLPASCLYQEPLAPYGSTPLTDPLFSTENFVLEHDGAEYSRAGKLRAMSHWPELLENLRVCNQRNAADINCGRCEKCVRNILCLRVIGIRNAPCFPGTVSNRTIRKLRLRGTDWGCMSRVLDAAHAAGISHSWVGVLENTLRREKIYKRLEAPRERLKRKLPSRILTALRAVKARSRKRLIS